MSEIPGKGARDATVVQAHHEPIIEPDLPIVDPHHHLWSLTPVALASMEAANSVVVRAFAPVARSCARYLFDEFLADMSSGHNIRATVFVDSHTMYRASGAETMKSVGEIEFANGIAAMAASMIFGDAKVCAGIVGSVDLSEGDAVEGILRAHIDAGGGRYRGIRNAKITAYDADPSLLGPGGVPYLLANPKFRAGFRWLHQFGLSFDVWVLEPQLPELVDLARAFPETQIILNHVGGPVAVANYAGKREQRFTTWSENIRTLAACKNVAVKLGGLGMPTCGFKSFMSTPPTSSAKLASEWKPYILSCIDAFGVERCMFESNFPVDSGTCTYPVLWNVFKHLTSGASKDEKTALFSGTACRVYRLTL